MDTKDAEAVLNAYEDLLERALWIVDGAPYWKVPMYKEWSALSIVGDEAVLRWPVTSSGYDGDIFVEEESVSFPVRLLFLPVEVLTGWKMNELAAYEKAQDERNRRLNSEKAAQRRALYEQLRGEFEPVRVYDKKPASS